jgi:hypothetical protein
VQQDAAEDPPVVVRVRLGGIPRRTPRRGLYTDPPTCQGCGAPLISTFETCACGGRSQYVSRTANRAHGPDDGWSHEAEALLAREVEAPQLRSWREAKTWQQKFSAVRRRYAGP